MGVSFSGKSPINLLPPNMNKGYGFKSMVLNNILDGIDELDELDELEELDGENYSSGSDVVFKPIRVLGYSALDKDLGKRGVENKLGGECEKDKEGEEDDDQSSQTEGFLEKFVNSEEFNEDDEDDERKEEENSIEIELQKMNSTDIRTLEYENGTYEVFIFD